MLSYKQHQEISYFHFVDTVHFHFLFLSRLYASYKQHQETFDMKLPDLKLKHLSSTLLEYKRRKIITSMIVMIEY